MSLANAAIDTAMDLSRAALKLAQELAFRAEEVWPGDDNTDYRAEVRLTENPLTVVIGSAPPNSDMETAKLDLSDQLYKWARGEDFRHEMRDYL